MATQPPKLDPLKAPQHFVPPTARELRAQAVQRLQAGLFGLAAIVLLVGLANIINDRARLAESGETVAVEPAKGEGGGDPLADLGVVPAASPDAAKGPSDAPKN
ncbi:MAG: hypothetical protein ACK442_10940 [Novosphingobium sp.]|jgi:hypothetical protein|nr:hypothetical protein [Brevundimonas sp.]MCZ8323610.1 hypothetical protein [Novosphingobium sp.]